MALAMTEQPAARLALSPLEAARSIGVSRSTFYLAVLPELAVLHVGRRTLVPVSELDAYLRRHARRDDQTGART
jgi:hypothetical protein